MGIRNRATVVGNICSAVPSLDSGPVLLVYEAEVHLMDRSGESVVSILDWFKGPRKTALRKNQIVTGISISIPQKAHAGCYVRLGRYRGEDLAQAGVGVLALKGPKFRVAFNALAPVPLRAEKIENLLNSNSFSEELLLEAKNLIDKEITPISDIRSTKEYRMHMAKVMFIRGVKTALSTLERWDS